VDNVEAKKRKWVSNTQIPSQITIDSGSNHDPSPPPQPTPIVEEATLATSPSKPHSGASKHRHTMSHKKTEEGSPTQSQQVEKLMKEICAQLAKQQVSHNDMIRKMHILGQQFSLPSLLESPSSTNPTLKVLRSHSSPSDQCQSTHGHPINLSQNQVGLVTGAYNEHP
jgi:hypothetical protein